MPLTKKFRSTSRAKAFLIASLIAATVIAISVEVRLALDQWETTKDISHGWKLLLEFLTAFIIGISIYGISYFLIDYGTGMLTCDSCDKRVKKKK